MRKRIYRAVWLIFYIPIITLEVLIFIFWELNPLARIYYFIKCGDSYKEANPVLLLYLDAKLKNLLKKIENG